MDQRHSPEDFKNKLWETFGEMNRDIFFNSAATRFTLFRQSSRETDHIVPWYRYRRDMNGPEHPFQEAQQSKAKYKRGESVTGKTWEREHAGKDLFFVWFPEFRGRQEFENYYRETLQIPVDVVDGISDYMIRVQAIFSYAFLGVGKQLLSVLSLDLQTKTRISEDGLFLELEGKILGTNAMAFFFRRLQGILETVTIESLTEWQPNQYL